MAWNEGLFCSSERKQVAFDPPLEPMLAPQRRWETKAAAAFVHRRLRSRCPETQDDTLAAQSGVADATAEAAPAPAGFSTTRVSSKG